MKRKASKTTQERIIYVNIEDLVPAEWNYKKPATEDQLRKLCASIERDKSIGVLPTRRLNGKHEVIDGNHRLEAIKMLGWKVVPCEDFGEISIAEAVTIARRRNYQWFEDDHLKLAEVFTESVFPEIDINELETFMPDSRQDLEDLSKLLEFDWDQFKDDGESVGESPEDENTLKMKLPEVVNTLWREWKDVAKEELGKDSDVLSFELALIRAIDWTKKQANEN